MRAFEDFAVGQTIDHGQRTVSAADIAAFADTYDPESAGTGAPIASGWQVALTFMQLMADSMLLDSTSMGSPGIETLNWLKPVGPGGTIRARSTVIETRVSKSRPEMGLVRFRHEAVDADGGTVIAIENSIMFGRRAGAAS